VRPLLTHGTVELKWYLRPRMAVYLLQEHFMINFIIKKVHSLVRFVIELKIILTIKFRGFIRYLGTVAKEIVKIA